MIKISIFLTLFVLALSPSAVAAEQHQMKPYQGTPEFEKIKTLVGTWKGTHVMGQTENETTVEYTVTSNGSAVVEKLSPGTPHEMISVYHDRGNKLSMTHYCGLANQPELDLVSSDANQIKFDFAARSNIDAAKEWHMHALTLTFDDQNKMTHNWSQYKDGKPAEITTITLMRAS